MAESRGTMPSVSLSFSRKREKSNGTAMTKSALLSPGRTAAEKLWHMTPFATFTVSSSRLWVR